MSSRKPSSASFLRAFPQRQRVPDALYGLGESYFQRDQHSDAIEPYLKVVTDYAQSPRAADSMLRLGQTLGAINQKEQACATLDGTRPQISALGREAAVRAGNAEARVLSRLRLSQLHQPVDAPGIGQQGPEFLRREVVSATSSPFTLDVVELWQGRSPDRC